MVDGEGDVDDPVWGTRETYRSTVEELVNLLEQGFTKIEDLTSKSK
jgi:hypothetical protein